MAFSKFNPPLAPQDCKDEMTAAEHKKTPQQIQPIHGLKNILILSTGLAGVGKTTHLREIAQLIPNCVYIDKDLINEAFLGTHSMQSDYYNVHVKMQTYALMIKQALSQLSLGKVVIIDGGVGGKLTSVFKNYLDTKEFTTKVIYFHCSGETQRERVIERNAARDNDKKGDAFIPYRHKHITEHLQELAQIAHLSVDTEDPANLRNNIKLIIDYIRRPRQACFVSSYSLPRLTQKDAMKGLSDIKFLLHAYTRAISEKDIFKLFSINLSLFKKMEDKLIAQNRHRDPKLQEEYKQSCVLKFVRAKQ